MYIAQTPIVLSDEEDEQGLEPFPAVMIEKG